MSIILIVLLVLLAVATGLIRWRRTSRGFLVAAALLFILVGYGVLSAWILPGLQSPYKQRATIQWAPKTAIVLLGAGTVRASNHAAEPSLFANGRMLEALALYRQCVASASQCVIEVSGGDARETGTPEAVVYAQVMQKLGVPKQDLLLEPHSMNTWQNAQFSAPLLKQWGAQKVVLVSSATHLRRASLYFKHFGIKTTPVRGDWLVPIRSWWPNAWNITTTDVAIHEYLGIARYHLYNAMGWNPTSTEAGGL